jgi:CheY-like chemotaxis protein
VAPRFGGSGRDGILVIDDYEPEARLIRRLLETRPDAQVFVAHSGAEALEVASATKPALIIMDLTLPDIGGDKLLALLRARPETQNTPVVVLASQDGQDPDVRRQLAAGVDSIWSKSVLDRSSFLTHIDGILAR